MSDRIRKERLLKGLQLKREQMIHLCFNPRDLASRPTKKQESILQDINNLSERYVLGGNQSGKTNLGARELTWVFNNAHPYWEKKPDHPLLIMVVGKTHKIVKEEIWEGKIKPFLKEGTYKVRMDGSALNTVTHKESGNRILFFSHKSPEECRQAVQAFVADYVWLDEMPSNYRLLTELHTRCQATSAPFIATFTPLLRDAEIKNHIENGKAPISKKYFLYTYDNPIYTGEQLHEMKQKHALMSESERATRTEGSWYSGDNAVYKQFDVDKCVEKPLNYTPTWRHLLSVDPASGGVAGLLILAEDPNTNVWYVVDEKYFKGQAPSELLASCDKVADKYNVVRRIADSHEAWFIKEAALHKTIYDIPRKKTQRKKELIENINEFFYTDILKIAPWCPKLIDEMITCQYTEDGSRIINSRHYHLSDCLQYGMDCKPSTIHEAPNKPIHQMRREAHQKRRILEAQEARKPKISYARIMPGKKSRWN